MNVTAKSEHSSLTNQDVNWFLFDETLWVTKYKEYMQIDDSIAYSMGSFNWLYESNDTVLFHKKDARFETAVIGLSARIELGFADKYINYIFIIILTIYFSNNAFKAIIFFLISCRKR